MTSQEQKDRRRQPGMPIFRYFWPNPFSIFSYFVFLFLNFLSLFVFIFCEPARTRRFSVIFAKVQWHPWTGNGGAESLLSVKWRYKLRFEKNNSHCEAEVGNCK